MNIRIGSNLNKNANSMYFVLKSLNFIYIIPLYMFLTPLRPSSGDSQLHMQSLVPCGAWFVVSSSPAGLEDTTNQAPHGTRDCMCSWEASDDGRNGVRNM